MLWTSAGWLTRVASERVKDQGAQERSGLFHSWYTDLSLQGKGEQCNWQVSHHRSCRGREPCHRLGQGKSGRQRGTATNQMDKRCTLDQEDTEVHESGYRILPTQPHIGPGDIQVTCSIWSRCLTDIETSSIGNPTRLCRVISFSILNCTSWMNLFNSMVLCQFSDMLLSWHVSTCWIHLARLAQQHGRVNHTKVSLRRRVLHSFCCSFAIYTNT